MAGEQREATIWSRIHARQALVFGLLGSIFFFIVLALPLAIVIALPSLPAGATIGVYGAGFVLDAVVGIGLLTVAIRCAVRAARGELFSIPVVTSIVERWFDLGEP